MKLLAIDPGLKGYLAVKEDGGVVRVHPLPTRPAGRKRTLDAGALYKLLAQHSDATLAVVEQQFCLPRQGVASTYKTGHNAGICEGMLLGLGVSLYTPSPKEWQKALKFPPKRDRKEVSIEIASKAYPDVSLKATNRCRTNHDGIADALNLLTFCRLLLEHHE